MSRQEVQREKYRAAGLVQINVWIPADKKREILEDCAQLRLEHLRRKHQEVRNDD